MNGEQTASPANTAVLRADAMIQAEKTYAEQKQQVIADLLAEQKRIEEALVALGAKAARKRKPGRPVGSRTRKPAEVQA